MNSTRLPGKVMLTVGGIPMVKRVWNAAKAAMAGKNAKIMVAWPERYPDLDENNVLERFQRICQEFPSKFVIRLTADCPLLHWIDIREAMDQLPEDSNGNYYSNRRDGHDVQITRTDFLFDPRYTDREHVIKDPFPTEVTHLSVDNRCDLERVRRICKIK